MNEGSRLSRWSQRKLAARHGGALPDPAEITNEKIRPVGEQLPAARDRQELATQTPDAVSAKAPVAGADTAEGEEMLAEADLPPIEGLTAQSDYTVFLKKNVPEILRKAALRKLWVSDPVLANLDGLNDYDDDYTIVTAMTMNDTSYKVGRGLLDDNEPKPELESGTPAEVQAETAPKLAQTGDAPAESGERTISEPDETNAATDEPAIEEDSAVEAAGNGDSVAPPVASADATQPVGAAKSEDERDSGAVNEKKPG